MALVDSTAGLFAPVVECIDRQGNPSACGSSHCTRLLFSNSDSRSGGSPRLTAERSCPESPSDRGHQIQQRRSNSSAAPARRQFRAENTAPFLDRYKMDRAAARVPFSLLARPEQRSLRLNLKAPEVGPAPPEYHALHSSAQKHKCSMGQRLGSRWKLYSASTPF